MLASRCPIGVAALAVSCNAGGATSPHSPHVHFSLPPLQAELDRRLATDTQSVAEGGEGEEPWTPRSSSAASSASAAFSVQ